jgi:protease IV
MTVMRHPEPAPPRPARRGCLWAILLLQGVVILGLLAVVLARGIADLAGGTSADRHGDWGVDEFPDMTEVWSQGDGEAKVVAIPLNGFISLAEESGFFPPAPGSTPAALRAIRRATHDSDVRALILSIDSGGGGITASDVLFNALRDFKAADPDRRIVALFGDVAASGAYYTALAADRIVAHPTTLTGSIGVLIQSLNWRELGAKIGLKGVTIKSGPDKDLLNPFGDLTESQRLMLQEIVDSLHDRFVTLVAESRGLSEAEARSLADGRVMTAQKALAAGLIDTVGYWRDAVDAAAALLNEPSVRVYRYEERFSLSAFLRSALPWRPRALLERAAEPRIEYRWSL